jgi:hypothetical protein
MVDNNTATDGAQDDALDKIHPLLNIVKATLEELIYNLERICHWMEQQLPESLNMLGH